MGMNYGGESMDARRVFEEVTSRGVSVMLATCGGLCRGCNWIISDRNVEQRGPGDVADAI
jgi:hypothetical protein